MKIKDQILEYKTEYIKGTFNIKEIAFLLKCNTGYVSKILNFDKRLEKEALYINRLKKNEVLTYKLKDSSTKEQINNEKLFKLFKEITKVTEIIAPNYLQPFKVGDMVVGDYK
jgi:hypothetical protein